VMAYANSTKEDFALSGSDSNSSKRRRGRPRIERPKVRVSLRLDRGVLEGFRADGPGWQTRINAALLKAMGAGLEPIARADFPAQPARS
jgi:uncharacterized protein (DUF4415 family)